MEKREILKLSKIILDYIFNLDDSSIFELLNGNKKLTLIKDDKNNHINDSSYNLKIKDILNKLNSFNNKDEAKAYLTNNKFTIKLLKDVAKQSDIYIKSKYNKSQIINSLVEGTVGASIKINILMGKEI